MVLATVAVLGTVVPLPRSAVNVGQAPVGVQLAGPVEPASSSMPNGTYERAVPATSGTLDERAMSTQPRPTGPGCLVAFPLDALSESRSAATPWPEPFGRSKLQVPGASGLAAAGLGTMLFC